MTRVLVIDYGIGNLGNVVRALQRLGAEVRLSEDPADLEWADRLILPGVGAFGDGHGRPAGPRAGWRPCGPPSPPASLSLGICLGMQLLFEESEEMVAMSGLGLLRGRVRRFPPEAGKIPADRMEPAGAPERPSPVAGGLGRRLCLFRAWVLLRTGGSAVVIATTVYGIRYASAVARRAGDGGPVPPRKKPPRGPADPGELPAPVRAREWRWN
jgi:glutamine amidotransferase